MDLRDSPDEAAFREQLRAWLRENLPAEPGSEWSRKLYEAGYAGLTWPVEYGGRGAPYSHHAIMLEEVARHGAPQHMNVIALGMAGPTIMTHGTEEQKRRYLPKMLTAEEIWCQGFSEPGAGSDLAAVRTRIEDKGDHFLVNGQKVWSSVAHLASFCILVGVGDPTAPRYEGLTYVIADMKAPGVEVRPLRQITGEAEFNEVFLTDVRIPDSDRLGAVGEGWAVAQTTLMNERIAIGGGVQPREFGMIGVLAREWRERPEVRDPGLHDALMQGWVGAEAARLAGIRLTQQLAAGQPGPEGSASKISFARLNQQLSGLEMELLGEEGLRHDDWTMRRSRDVDFFAKSPSYRYMRAKGNSIEGGTSEILRNIIAERVLGLPSEIRVDKDVAWKDIPR